MIKFKTKPVRTVSFRYENGEPIFIDAYRFKTKFMPQIQMYTWTILTKKDIVKHEDRIYLLNIEKRFFGTAVLYSFKTFPRPFQM